jgi:hypothetical protein
MNEIPNDSLKDFDQQAYDREVTKRLGLPVGPKKVGPMAKCIFCQRRNTKHPRRICGICAMYRADTPPGEEVSS